MKKFKIISLCLLVIFIAGCGTQAPQNPTAKVSKGTAEKIEIDGIKISGKYNKGVMKIKLENTSASNYLITEVIMTTYKNNKKLNSHKFKLNQLLAASKTTEMSFMERVEDFDKIEYDITKEKA